MIRLPQSGVKRETIWDGPDRTAAFASLTADCIIASISTCETEALVKPNIQPEQIPAILARHFDGAIRDLRPVGTGQISRAFSFSVGERSYVVRFVAPEMAASFGKDDFIARRLSGAAIPVPPILHRGCIEGMHYAISPKYPGVQSDSLPDEGAALLPVLIETLDEIHRADVGDTTGCGFFEAQGVGQRSSVVSPAKLFRD